MRELESDQVEFSFEIGDPVCIELTGEYGVVRGFRRMFEEFEDFYWIEYVNSAGAFSQEWIRESLLSDADCDAEYEGDQGENYTTH